ncbi:hypothetical protein HPSA_05870 [Helicobacter pylori SouthAfrica7]|uniref:Uncharacterized protein n=1 Tax=Helicobacter pylori (strain SouthAfrica7) TaxID=907239 RepID=E8QT29_HELPW|nr:hypothetical protein HPSA_05870 [Helicobacter pylori SouthAfrica7]
MSDKVFCVQKTLFGIFQIFIINFLLKQSLVKMP